MKALHLAIATLALGASSTSFARCHISNETKYSFSVESGHTSNQSVGSNTTTTIDDGKIKAKSKEGKSFGGSCKDGDTLVVKEEDGIVIMSVK